MKSLLQGLFVGVFGSSLFFGLAFLLAKKKRRQSGEPMHQVLLG
jgi:hypothetical protein